MFVSSITTEDDGKLKIFDDAADPGTELLVDANEAEDEEVMDDVPTVVLAVEDDNDDSTWHNGSIGGYETGGGNEFNNA